MSIDNIETTEEKFAFSDSEPEDVYNEDMEENESSDVEFDLKKFDGSEIKLGDICST